MKTSGELGKEIFEDISSTEIISLCRREFGKVVWYLGDDQFTDDPADLVGLEVEVEPPSPQDAWSNSFVGQVSRLRDGDIVVVDQLGNAYQMDATRVEPTV